MGSKRRIKAAPFTAWIFVGLLVSVVAHSLMAMGLAVTPYYSFAHGDAGPPEPLELPWVRGWLGWTFLIGTVGITSIAVWLNRGREERTDSVALIALCVGVLGFAEGITGALLQSTTQYWPVNLIDVSIWLLLAAAALGALSWVRILISKRAVHGKVFATCAIVCCSGYAWVISTFLVEYPDAYAMEDGIELPVAHHSREFNGFWNPEGEIPLLRVRVDGVDEQVDVAEIARNMLQGDGLPDEVIMLGADARATWKMVRGALERVQDARIWKVFIATRWEAPPVTTHYAAYLPKRMGIHVPGAAAPPPPPSALLRIFADGSFTVNDEPAESVDALAKKLRRLHRTKDGEKVPLSVLPDEATRWQDIVTVMDRVKSEYPNIHLGRFFLSVY